MWHLGVLAKLLGLLLLISFFAFSQVGKNNFTASIVLKAFLWLLFMALNVILTFLGGISFQGFFESIFSVWPISKLFELNGSIHEWWFRWKLDRFVSQMCSVSAFKLFLSFNGFHAKHLQWYCCFAGGHTWDVICLHLSGAAEAPGAVRGQRRDALLCQDFKLPPLTLCGLLHSKTFVFAKTMLRFTR